jgi:hypothetical protein
VKPPTLTTTFGTPPPHPSSPSPPPPGILSDADLKDMWADTDVVVSLSKGEGWGLVPREAMSRGVSVVVSDIPAYEDLRGTRALFVRTTGLERAQFSFTTEGTGNYHGVLSLLAR